MKKDYVCKIFMFISGLHDCPDIPDTVTAENNGGGKEDFSNECDTSVFRR